MLAYGRLTGWRVDFVSTTLTQVDALQTRMLQHSENVWSSSAVGRHQIVRTSCATSARRSAFRAGSYDRDMQDRLACFCSASAASTSNLQAV